MNKAFTVTVLSLALFSQVDVGAKKKLPQSPNQVFSNNTYEKMVFPTVLIERPQNSFGSGSTKGSGVIFSKNNKKYVLTARHCVIDPSNVNKFIDGKIKLPKNKPVATIILGNLKQDFKLTLKYMSSKVDFAILSIDQPPATSIGLGRNKDFNLKLRTAVISKISDFNKLYLTDKIYCVGFPGPLRFQVIEKGSISFVNPQFDTFGITSPVVPGNSGGPIFNHNMEVIGIVSFIYKLRNGQLVTHLCNVIPITAMTEAFNVIR